MGTVDNKLGSLWSDIDADFSITRSGDCAMYIGVNSIKSSIKNILNTPIGKALMDGNFGVGIYKSMYDMLDDITIDFLKTSISNEILNYEPRIIVNSIDIQKTSDTSILIVIIFTVKDTKMEDSVTFKVTL